MSADICTVSVAHCTRSRIRPNWHVAGTQYIDWQMGADI